MAKDAYYFSHDANSRNDEKIISLRMDLGWEGYGLYWALVEMLRESASYELELNCNRIAFALHADKECISDLILNYDLFENDGKIFWSSSLKKRMAAKDEKSKKARESAQKRWNKCKSNANASNPQSAGNANKSKGKESKEKERIRELVSALFEKRDALDELPKFVDYWCAINELTDTERFKEDPYFESSLTLKVTSWIDKTKPKTVKQNNWFAGKSKQELDNMVEKMRAQQATTQDIEIFNAAVKEGYQYNG